MLARFCLNAYSYEFMHRLCTLEPNYTTLCSTLQGGHHACVLVGAWLILLPGKLSFVSSSCFSLNYGSHERFLWSSQGQMFMFTKQKYLRSIYLHGQRPSAIPTTGNWSHVTEHVSILGGWIGADLKGAIDTDSGWKLNGKQNILRHTEMYDICLTRSL